MIVTARVKSPSASKVKERLFLPKNICLSGLTKALALFLYETICHFMYDKGSEKF
jgi:hypothetical protein